MGKYPTFPYDEIVRSTTWRLWPFSLVACCGVWPLGFGGLDWCVFPVELEHRDGIPGFKRIIYICPYMWYIYICVYHGIKYKLIVLETGDRCVIANFNAFTRSKWLKLQLSFSDLTSKLPSYSSRCWTVCEGSFQQKHDLLTIDAKWDVSCFDGATFGQLRLLEFVYSMARRSGRSLPPQNLNN